MPEDRTLSRRRSDVAAVGHDHDWQANGLNTKTVDLDGGFIQAKRTFAVQSCGCGAVRQLLVSEDRWRPYA